eukprot:6278447-Prymnesium_polylepis.1
MRHAIERDNSYNGTAVGTMVLGGTGPAQMDGAAQTYAPRRTRGGRESKGPRRRRRRERGRGREGGGERARERG